MDPRLVPGSVFKTGEPYGNHAVGGFDSHALPPFWNLLVFGAERVTPSE